MINSNVYNIAAASAAALLDVTGKVVMPAGNSPLAALVGLSYVGSSPVGQEITYSDVLQAITQDTVDGPSAHTASMYAQAETLIPMVSSHISFVQNEVGPKVYKFEEALYDVVNKVDGRNPMESFDVVQVSAPEPAFDEDLIALVKQFADDNARVPLNLRNFPEMSSTDIANAMEVSSARVNASIKRWISERGEDWLSGLWATYFAPSAMPDRVDRAAGGFMGIRGQAPFQRLDTGLALFLIARGLFDSPPENVNYDLNEWRASMDDISRFAGAQALTALRLLDGATMQNTLILSSDSGSRRIMVNSKLYDKFIEQGGMLDIIIGAVLSGKSNSYSMDDVNANGFDYQAIWNSFKTANISAMEAQAALILRAEALAIFATCVKPCNEDESILLADSGRTEASLLLEAKNYIDALSLKQLRDARCIAVDLIAGIRFSHTPAKQFIKDMQAAEEAGCKSPQEAAGIAALNYICSFAACNLALGNPQ